MRCTHFSIMAFSIFISSGRSFLRNGMRSRSFATKYRGNKASIDFGAGFKIPSNPDPLELEKLNAHENDSRLEFDSELHKYYIDGKPVLNSVTEIVGSFFEEFDAELAVTKMMGGRNWPRPEYLDKAGNPMEKEDILKKWESTGTFARNLGTYMHWNIEKYLNGIDHEPSPEIQQFVNFNSAMIEDRDITPHRTEWRVFDPVRRIAGTIDFVGRRANGNYVIIDWKRAKDLQTKLANIYRKAKPPLDYLDDCSGVKYSLQLNMYRYILQTYYGIIVDEMLVVSFHPNLENYFYFPVEVSQIIICIIHSRHSNFALLVDT